MKTPTSGHNDERVMSDERPPNTTGSVTSLGAGVLRNHSVCSKLYNVAITARIPHASGSLQVDCMGQVFKSVNTVVRWSVNSIVTVVA